MEYKTVYVWQDGGSEEVPYFSLPENRIDRAEAMLLRHFRYKKVEICVMAICRTKEMGEYIADWCETFPWGKAARQPRRWIAQAREELWELIGRNRSSAKVLVGIDRQICVSGDYGKAFCIQGFFGKGKAQTIENLQGEITEGTGILLADAMLIEKNADDVGETLRFAGSCTEEKMRRHLQELERHRNQAGAGCAILLIAE